MVEGKCEMGEYENKEASGNVVKGMKMMRKLKLDPASKPYHIHISICRIEDTT